MKSHRFRNVIAAATAIAAVSVSITWRVYAQSTQTGPATATPMGHMMHDGDPAIPDHEHMHEMMAPGGRPPVSAKSDDPRQLVSLPGPMQEHMLASMRDHLATLNTVIGDIADAKFDTASKLLEERLGMSSFTTPSRRRDGTIFSSADAGCWNKYASCGEPARDCSPGRLRRPDIRIPCAR